MDSAGLSAALHWFFETSEMPVVICDPQLKIIMANHAFGVRVGVKSEAELPGQELGRVLRIDLPPVRDADADQEVLVILPGGAEAIATLRSVEEHVIVSLDAGIEGARLARARRALEDQERVFAIGRLLSLLMSEDDLVGVVAQALGDLFPGRHYCVRTVDGESHQLLSLYAEGTLRPKARAVISLKRSAVRKLRLSDAVLASEQVEVCTEHEFVFEEGEVGIGVPLVAGGQLLGQIDVEGTEGQFDDREADERLAIGLANQLAVALRNARLLTEARYLRGYLEKLIEQANALVLAVDRHGRINIFNRACQRLSGFSRAEVASMPFSQLVVPDQRERLERLLDLAMHGQSGENIEVTVLRRDGKERQVALNTAPILGKDGLVDSVVVIGTDLSRLVELERQVVHAEKLATLGQLAAAVVHELNNPLTSIVAYADALRGRMELLGNAGDRKKAEKIMNAAERILKFSRDLLTYARPGSEQRSRVSLQDVIAESVRFCDHVLKTEGVEVRVDWEEGIPTIHGNRGRLQQVFVNLITNACHAMKGGGSLEIVGRLSEGVAEVRVNDSGPGLSPEIAARIFEPFFSTKAPGQGTGLGLSIVREIIGRHTGTIEVEEAPGGGAGFVIRLPVAG
ncbi:MAG: PAS domain-containing protein [Deltaproteobacteria bacterium]|nr:PAS domain-containing protein [Deltaproteobacteria bacterium]